MTQPDTPGHQFVAAVLGGTEGGHPTSAATGERSWWREFWTAIAGRAGAVGDSARSQPTDEKNAGTQRGELAVEEQLDPVAPTTLDECATDPRQSGASDTGGGEQSGKPTSGTTSSSDTPPATPGSVVQPRRVARALRSRRSTRSARRYG
jgi:hypothetical protein